MKDQLFIEIADWIRKNLHELNNDLNNISGSASLVNIILQQMSVSEDQTELVRELSSHIQTIHTACFSAAKTIQAVSGRVQEAEQNLN